MNVSKIHYKGTLRTVCDVQHTFEIRYVLSVSLELLTNLKSRHNNRAKGCALRTFPD